MRRLTRWLGAALVALSLGACGSDDGDGGSGPGTPGIALSLSKTTLTAVQGGSDNLTATITRSGGFTGTVSIETTGAPTGVTAAASNVATSGGTTTGTVTVTVANTVAAGTYNLTVRASGSGVTAVTVPVTLTVTAIPSSITVAASPTTLTLEQGASNTVAISLTRTNYEQAVQLTVEGAPAGLTANFAPASVTATSSILTIGAGTAAAGTYPLTIRATGAGVSAATTVVQLTINAAPPEPSYELGLSAQTLSVGQGASGEVTVNLTRTNFTGTVNLSLQGNAPAGITASFTPAAVTGTTSTLSVQVGGAVTPGNHDLVVRSEAEGFDPQTATLTLTVTETGPAPDYSLSLSPAGSVNVQAGGASVNVTVNIDRVGGLTAPVALSVGALPTGVTATFNPASTAGNTSTLTIQAASGATTGAQQITVTGASTGLPNKTLNVGVQVAPASGSSGNVSLDVGSCALDERPLWVAAQNGTGPWARVTPTGTVYSFDITEARGGLALVRGEDGGSGVGVMYFSQAEFLSMNGAVLCGTGDDAGKTVTATVAGLGFTDMAFLSIGGGMGTGTFGAASVPIQGVANGTFDLIGYKTGLLGGGAGDRIIIRRDINTAGIANNGSVGATLDFASGEAFAPATATFTISNGLLGGESVMYTTSYSTGASCVPHVLSAFGSAASASFTVYGIPAARQRPTDFHRYTVMANNMTGSAGTSRGVTATSQALANTSVTLPGTIAALTPGNVAGPYRRLQFQYTLPTGAVSSTTALYAATSGGQAVTISASATYLGGTAVDLTMPDFSGLAGWNNAWAPASGSSGTWSVSGAGAELATACGAAGQVVFSSRVGTF